MSNRYEEIVKSEWEKFENNGVRPNIMLLGATGCGKSSLINVVFNANIADVNDFSRGTEKFERHDGADHGLGVNLIDSRGYELEDGENESYEKYCEAIKKEMEDSRKKDPLGKIHIIWYCISVSSGKVQDYDIEILKMLRNDPELKKRVCVVLTKCDRDTKDRSKTNAMRDVLSSEIGSTLRSFCVSNKSELRLDLEELIDWSADQVDNKDMREAFILSQTISLKAKRNQAGIVIAFYAAAAAAIGAAPIPLAAAALLTPLQLIMSTHIIRSYGIDSFDNIAKGVVGSALIPNLGKALAGGLLKLIPGIGQVAGAIINGAVASSLTTALGCAISQICFVSCEKIAHGEQVDTSAMFSAENIKLAMSAFEGMEKDKDKNEYISSEKVDKTEVEEFAKSYKSKYKDNLEE